MAGRKNDRVAAPAQAAESKKMTEERKNEMRARLEKLPARSAWLRGVKTYAKNMLEELFDNGHDVDGLSRAGLLDAALNGARDWKEYSWGGCALIYDGDIAATLCNPSELKKTRGGERRPNSREEWPDVQARALHQAFNMIDYARRPAGSRG